MSETKSDRQSITFDPIYYTTAAFFALLTTALPAILGQPRFLPIVQTLALTTFVTVALHHRNVPGAVKIVALWLPIQFLAITLLTWFFGTQLESAFNDGFAYRAAITSWFFAGAPFPHGLTSAPAATAIEVAAVLLGSLATAGVIGFWFLVRLVNQAAYGAGILMEMLTNPAQAFLVIPYWTLLRAAAYGGLIVPCALPLLTYQWSPVYYWGHHRRLVVISVALLALALLVELFLPDVVARPPLT
jgi:hypothetical protein